jgi:multimeric flavodoxin WrbA
MSQAIDFTKISVEILLINGSPRSKSNTLELIEQVRGGVLAQPGATVTEFSFQNAHFGETGFEDVKNSFDELLTKWKSADGIIFAAPIYTAAAPGVDYTALDLLDDALAYDAERIGEYKKAGGVLIQGSAPWGLQELGAQHIIERFVALHTIPVERLVGRVIDKERPTEELLEAAVLFGQSVTEHAKLIKAAYQNPPEVKSNVLIINAGIENPEAGRAIEARAKSVIEAAGSEVSSHSLVGKKLEGCRHCIQFCVSKGYCRFDDDFTEFLAKWLKADGYLVIASADTQGPPAIVRSALDRLSEHVFQTGLREHLEKGVPPFNYPRYSRPTASIAYGKRRYGGQTSALQALIAHDVHRGNYPIGGRDPHSPIGAAGFLVQASQLGCDQFFTTAIDRIAADVADLSNRILTAKKRGYETIPQAFYASREKMGVRDKEVYADEFGY